MTVARQLVASGKVERAFLGVRLDSQFSQAMATQIGLPRLMGSRVVGITPNSPASAAGMQEGDVILQIDDTPIEDDAHVVNFIKLREIGEVLSLIIYRNRDTLRLEVAVGKAGS